MSSTSSFARNNALWLREWRVSSRMTRTPWLVAGAGVTLASILLFVGATSWQPASDVGRTLFQVNFALSALFVTLFGPALAANTIALEREGRTWEALVMAGVTPRAIDRGKFWGAYSHLAVYLLALLPSAGIPHVFGGVAFGETVLGIVMVFALGAITVRFGMAMSAMVPSSRAALLVTLCVAALLCFVVSLLGFGLTDLLRRQLQMNSLDSEGPVFWPVALVHEAWGFDYARYLILIPVGGFAIAFRSLRELTVYLLDSASRDRPHRGTYVVLLLATAVVLGMTPGRSSGDAIVAEVVFSLCTFAGVVLVAGDRPTVAGPTIRRSLLLVAAGVAGMLVVFMVAFAMQPAAVVASSSEPYVVNFLLYAPAFTVFVTGLTACTRTLFRTVAIGRVVAVAITFALSLAPVVAFVLFKVSNASAVAVLALSPFGAVFVNASERAAVVGAALGWASLGAVLLAVTHRRERRSIQSS